MRKYPEENVEDVEEQEEEVEEEIRKLESRKQNLEEKKKLPRFLASAQDEPREQEPEKKPEIPKMPTVNDVLSNHEERILNIEAILFRLRSL